jgi:hypothetical protein
LALAAAVKCQSDARPSDRVVGSGGGGSIYAFGFHVVTTMAAARALDLELVRHLVVVKP